MCHERPFALRKNSEPFSRSTAVKITDLPIGGYPSLWGDGSFDTPGPRSLLSKWTRVQVPIARSIWREHFV